MYLALGDFNGVIELLNDRSLETQSDFLQKQPGTAMCYLEAKNMLAHRQDDRAATHFSKRGKTSHSHFTISALRPGADV